MAPAPLPPQPGLAASFGVGLLMALIHPAAWAAPGATDPCPLQQASRAPAPAQVVAVEAPAVDPHDYRHLLKPTALGWPRRDHWCVWVEPPAGAGPAALWDGRWQTAVQAALSSWGRELPITQVNERERAQVLILRRKPPLRGGRASHGRAELTLLDIERQGRWALEPQVQVLISPGQRPRAIQATALHELGHAFGLWGHSDQSSDAMAAIPGAQPVLELSNRDRASLHWLQSQPGLTPAAEPRGAGPAPAAPAAN